MISAPDSDCSLLKHYLRYAKHSEALRSKSVMFMYLYSPSSSVRYQVFVTLRDIIKDDYPVPLFNLNSACIIISDLMKADVFWKQPNMTELLYQLINLLARFERCLVLCWKMIVLFLAEGLNFGPMRIRHSLESLVVKHNTTLVDMLHKYKEDFSSVVELLIIHHVDISSDNLTELLNNVAIMFDYDDGKKFLSTFCLTTLLPHMFIYCPDQHLVRVLSDIASYLQMPLKKLIETYFDDIYTEFIFGIHVDGSKLDLPKLFGKLESIAGAKIQSLVSASNEMLLCKFMLNAASPSIMYTPRFLFLKEQENLITVLSGNMLSVLKYIDLCLQSPHSSLCVVNKSLKCLPTLITLLGPVNVTKMRFKLLSTLTSCQACHPNIDTQLYFFVWSNFIFSVNLRLIGPSLGSIFASLLPLVDKVAGAANLLKFLVIENGELYSDYLPDLFFVQDSSNETIHQIYLAIQACIAKSQGDYKEEITRIIRSKSKDTNLKLYSLNKLLQLLKKNSSQLHLLIVKADQLHPLIVRIIDFLMTTIRDSNDRVRNVCAACLGELGAIDPGRFTYNSHQQAVSRKLICEVNSVEFSNVCISGLIQGLQNAKNLQVNNQFVGAIQETLKLFLKKEGGHVSKESLMSRFVPSIREMLETLLAAKHVYMVPDLSTFTAPHPIFGSNCGSTVEDWVYRWSVRLITFIKDPFEKDIFLGCANCMKIDLQFAITLLPYILLTALVRCSDEERHLVEEEVKAVLHWKIYRSRQQNIIHIWKRIGKCSESVSPMFGDKSLESSRCIGIIFDLFDFLYKYATGDPKINLDSNPHIKNMQITVKDFLSNFPHKSLFLQSYVQKDYCRSLWHIEKILAGKKQNQDSLEQLKNIYSKLNDADGLVGVMGLFEKTPTMEETVLCHVVKGNIMDAIDSYRILSDKYPGCNFFQRALIQCYLSIDQPSTALQITRAITAASCPPAELFNEYTECLWTTLRTNEMEDLLAKFDPDMRNDWCWGVSVGQILSDMEQGRTISSKLISTRQRVVDMLAALSQDRHVAYRQGYQCVLKLHMLNELEKFAGLFEDVTMPGPCSKTSSYAMDLSGVTGQSMQLRLALLTPHSHDLHQVLRIRRVALSLLERKAAVIAPQCIPTIHNELSNICIKNFAIARKGGNTDGARLYISMAEQYRPAGLFVEKAKLLSARNQPDAAVSLLGQGISQYISSNDSVYKTICAKAKLLIAQYNDANINFDVKDGAKFFKEALSVCHWEKAYVALAKYLYNALTNETKLKSLSTDDVIRMEYETAYNFGMAMMYGCQYIYQSMPCMLSLWLDFVTRMVKAAGNENLYGLTRDAVDNVNNFNKMIETFFSLLPAYMFMTAFSQLISRMGHPYEPSFQLLKKIIVKMIITFPQQACWTFVSTLKSPHPVHKRRSMEILRDTNILNNTTLNTFISHFKDFVEKLHSLCLKPTSSNRKKVPLDSLVKGLKAQLKSGVEIMVPAQVLRTVALPHSKYDNNTTTTTSHSNYNPFPETLVYLVDVKDEVEILQSLQCPKKVTFIASDGVHYPLICKPKDDLRLDSRIMEFNSIVNMYLRRDPTTREKNLLVRTYSVVPLSNQCGLIEFVPNLLSFKFIINGELRKKGLYEVLSEVHSTLVDKRLSVTDRRIYFRMMLMKHPPVLQDWFFDNFHNPQTWYLARRGFIRTAAVMSIVGYIEGLGDRHCENILIDSVSGHVQHVDFNMLFNKGESLQFPELVPFRLTQNMISAMGSTGYEGMFIRSCEETTRVMRKYTDHLVATMKPFIHDPKIFDTKEMTKSKDQQLEYTNEVAKSHIDNVQRRLSGVVMTKQRSTRPLSVEGQVRLLIAEATNFDNLANMFPGWTPWI